MRIRSLQPAGIVCVDLDHFTCRIDIGVSMRDSIPCFSLLYRYPPSPAAIMGVDPATGHPQVIPMGSFAVVALLRAQVQVASDARALEPVTRAALGNGGFDDDVRRTTEAIKLFKNSPGVRDSTVDECLIDITAVLKVYWDIIEWMTADTRSTKRLTALNTTLLLEA